MELVAEHVEDVLYAPRGIYERVPLRKRSAQAVAYHSIVRMIRAVVVHPNVGIEQQGQAHWNSPL